MTQGGASQAVQQLEEHLQVQLIDRSRRPFVLTREGKAFHAGCLNLLRQFDSLVEEVRTIEREVQGQTKIAAIYSIGLSYSPNLKQAVAERFPKAKVHFQFGHPDEVYQLVEDGSVDFGLVSYPKATKTLQAEDWQEEDMILASASSHPLSEKTEVQQSDLANQGLVAFAPNLRIRHEIDRYLRQLDTTMQIAAELDNIDSVRHALEVNTAVAFLPKPSVQEEIRKGTVVELRCPWLNLQRPLGIIQRRSDSMTRTAREVKSLIIESVSSKFAQSGDSTVGLAAC